MKKKEILEEVERYIKKNNPERRFIAGKTLIPASGAVITPEDVSSIVESALQGWFTDFKFCARFREELSKVTGKKYVTLTNSGSSASLLAITACIEKYELIDYNSILTTAVGFPTTVASILQNNLTPVFVDIDPQTLQPVFDMNDYNYRSSVIWGSIFAHTLGFPFDEQLVMKYDRFLISDCCDALGAEYVGLFADVMTLSFFPAHQITSGEGGAVCTNDIELHTIIESYANWGRDCFCKPGQNNTCGNRFDKQYGKLPEGYDHKYVFSRLGYNTKITEMQAALGLSQLRRLPEFVKVRRYNFDRLTLEFPRKASEYFDLIVVPEWSKPSPFGFPMIRKSGAPFTLRDFIEHLENNKVATRRLFGGNLTKQPAFIDKPFIVAGDLSGSNKLMNGLVWVGCFPGITDEMIDYMLQVIEDFFVERGL